MSYRNGIGYNKGQYSEKSNNKIITVQQPDRIISYLYLNNVSGTDKNNQISYPDCELIVKLGRSITPKYFKLEYICIPSTFYQQANNRKLDTRVLQNPYIIQQAPQRMVWRETNGGPVTTFNLPLEPGNYTMDEFILAIQTIMNTSPNNQYTVVFNEINMRSEIRRISGTYEFALWFATTQENVDYYEKDLEEFCSVSLGYDTIPFVDAFTSPTDPIIGLKVSPLVMDLANDAIYLLEIEGTPAILNRGRVNGVDSPSFNATFIVNYNGNKGDYSSFTINKDFCNLVAIPNKITFETLKVTLREFETGIPIHLNGNSPYIVFSYEEYALHENFSIN